jgi:hypothetical protein
MVFALLQPQYALKRLAQFLTTGLIAGLLLGTVRYVPATRFGVVDLFGEVLDRVLPPGIHFVNPLSKVTLFSSEHHFLNTSVSLPVGNQSLKAMLRLSYVIQSSSLPSIYNAAGLAYERQIVLDHIKRVAQELKLSSSQLTQNAVVDLYRTKLTYALDNEGFEAQSIDIQVDDEST